VKIYIKKLILEEQNEAQNLPENTQPQDPMSIVQKTLKDRLDNIKNNLEESLLIAKEKHFNVPKFKPNSVINQNSDLYKSGIDDNRGIKQVFNGQKRAANNIKSKQINENTDPSFGHVSNSQSKLSNTTEAIRNKNESLKPHFNNKTTYHDRTISSPGGGTPHMKDGHRKLLQVDREKAYRDAKYYKENPNGPSS